MVASIPTAALREKDHSLEQSNELLTKMRQGCRHNATVLEIGKREHYIAKVQA
jgi:hypothetical protein